MGYTKLFSEIVASTIWREDDKTRLVWITMLALKNERHMVEASMPGLADLARVSMPECEAALKKLSSPDQHSRNKEYEGRRIQETGGGWLILNGEHYRAKMNSDDRREYQKLYQRKYRALKKSKPLDGEMEAMREEDPGIASRIVENHNQAIAERLGREDLGEPETGYPGGLPSTL